MIIADRKPLEELQEMIKPYDNIMLVGCKGCVTVCNVGGLKEVQILASTLRIARKKEGRPLKIEERVLERQCDPEYIEQLRDVYDQYDAVLIHGLRCGAPIFIRDLS
jgi:ferredoxin